MGLRRCIEKLLAESANSSKDQRKYIGRLAENIALDFLQKKNYKILYQNWKCALGEIDLIFKENETIVFVEVKSRKENNNYVFANITWQKQRKIHLLIKAFLKSNFRYRTSAVRIDVVGVSFQTPNLKKYKIEHIIGAF